MVESLVDQPEAVRITTSQGEGTLRFEIALDSADVGKVIGRGGRIIKSVRTLARAAGSTQGLMVDVEVVG